MPLPDPPLGELVQPLVSVVIPTHNREVSIIRAIDSVLNQSMQALEVIVVDDGSVDGTLAKIALLNEPRIKIISLPHRSGANAARNAGVSTSQAKWIAFQDSDDEWLPYKLAAHLDQAAKTDAAVVWSPVLTALHDPRNIHVTPSTDSVLSLLCEGNFISLQATLISRVAFEAVGGLDETMPRFQDWDLWLKLAKRGYRFTRHPAPSVRLHLSNDSLTSDRSVFGLAMSSLLNTHSDTYRSHPRAAMKHRLRLARYCLRDHDPLRATTHLLYWLRAAAIFFCRRLHGVSKSDR